jgi:hypothetical protein
LAVGKNAVPAQFGMVKRINGRERPNGHISLASVVFIKALPIGNFGRKDRRFF